MELTCLYAHMGTCPQTHHWERESGPAFHPGCAQGPSPTAWGPVAPGAQPSPAAALGPLCWQLARPRQVPRPPKPQPTPPAGHAQGQGTWGSLVAHLVCCFALWAVMSTGVVGAAAGFGPPRSGIACFPRGAGGQTGAGTWLSLKHHYLPCPHPPSSLHVLILPPSSWSLRTGVRDTEGQTGEL